MAWLIARRSFLLLALAACSRAPRFLEYHGPEVTQIRVFKTERRMELMHGDDVLRSYEIGLGFAPAGHKQRYGDGRTPEGEYTIDRRNPQSRYHLSLGISYPNQQDRERERGPRRRADEHPTAQRVRHDQSHRQQHPRHHEEGRDPAERRLADHGADFRRRGAEMGTRDRHQCRDGNPTVDHSGEPGDNATGGMADDVEWRTLVASAGVEQGVGQHAGLISDGRLRR